MLRLIKKFLDHHWDQVSPLLLGYSGGSDSKALLYLLHHWKVPLHVAHVDHGWREESGKEAEELRKEIEGLGLPFYLHRLAPAEKNKEARAREGRLSFFISLFEKFPYQALLLGHHAADVAETCLKRIAEGAHLPFLGGMDPVGKVGSLPVWRPLLFVEKEKLIRFLREKGLQPLVDPTSFDVRSQMRKEIFPLLEKILGKKHLENWSYLAERSRELKEYLEKKIATFRFEKRPWGGIYFLEGVERVEARYCIQKVYRASREEIELILDAIIAGKESTCFSERAWVHRGMFSPFSSKDFKSLVINELKNIYQAGETF